MQLKSAFGRLCFMAFIFVMACSCNQSKPPALATSKPSTSPMATTQATIHWVPWSDDIFTRAKRENKLVFVDVEAVWCHWCHVMDHITYHEPAVVRLLNENFIAVKVDQDSRPDISSRYEDYGWPATVILDGNANEIVLRQGYIPPGPMERLLVAVIDDPSPGPSARKPQTFAYANKSSLSSETQQQLQAKLDEYYDPKAGGWGTVHKYLDTDGVEWTMLKNSDESRARQSLDGPLKLIDPAWGGIYQYSTDADWDHPHFEKIMSFQAAGITTYSMAYAKYHDERYLKGALDIRRFLLSFLHSPDGAFYTSQNADVVDGQHSGEYFLLDDAARRKQGLPRVDQHIYTRENGWAIHALANLYCVTGDKQILDDAVRAADWIIKNRTSAGEAGGFRHDAADSAGPYLGDALAISRAFLSLYMATGDRIWLTRSMQSADFAQVHFQETQHASSEKIPGLLSSKAKSDSKLKSQRTIDENIAGARFFNLLHHYTGKPSYRATAENAMKYLATPEVMNSRRYDVAGILLADAELANSPLHITIVGAKSDAAAGALFAAALKSPVSYKRIEWWDRAEGPLANADVEYPELNAPAAFVCTKNSCSAPISDPETVLTRLQK